MNKEELEKQREEIIKKWEESGLLDDIGGNSDKIDLAKLMDGKARQQINNDLDIKKIIK
jgi:hypothetical protein